MKEEGEVVAFVVTLAGVGATAGCGVAAIIGAPFTAAALIGGGLACLGGAIIKGKEDH